MKVSRKESFGSVLPRAEIQLSWTSRNYPNIALVPFMMSLDLSAGVAGTEPLRVRRVSLKEEPHMELSSQSSLRERPTSAGEMDCWRLKLIAILIN